MTTEAPNREVIYQRPALYPKQEDALFTASRWGVVEASTKSGKTVGCICWIVEQAILNGGSGRNFWWIAPVNSVSKIAYRRLKRFLPDTVGWTSNDTEQTVTFEHGSVIWFKSAEKPDHLYGEDVYAAVVDEATRVKAASWTALRTTLTATGGPARIIGNVKGSKNWAYRMARKAEAGAPDYHYSKLTVWDAVEAGIFPKEEALDAKDQLTDAEFRELYLAEAADTDDQFFDIAEFHPVDDWPHNARVARAWDFAVTQTSKGGDPDYTVGAKLAWDGRIVYVVDVVRLRGEPDRVEQLVRKTVKADGPTCDQVLEEESGSAGKMMVQLFRRVLKEMGGAGRVFPASVSGGKEARAFMFASRVNQGDGRMVLGDWNQAFLDEADDFPEATHDDQVDAAAHAYNHLVPKTRKAGRSRVPGSG